MSLFTDIAGKRVLVTGASGGIGSAIARLYGTYGATVGVHYQRSREKAEAVVQSITSLAGRADSFQADLARPKESAALIKAFVSRFGGVDVLINNAGAMGSRTHYGDLNEADWDEAMALNARSPFFLTREAFKAMKRGGAIVNVSSIATKYGGSPQSLHYGAAKAALETMTVGFARYGAKQGIRVNCIRAGFIDTDFHSFRTPKEIKERVALIPLGRAGRPSDLANVALFLGSDASSFITGEVLGVAGGD